MRNGNCVGCTRAVLELDQNVWFDLDGEAKCPDGKWHIPEGEA